MLSDTSFLLLLLLLPSHISALGQQHVSLSSTIAVDGQNGSDTSTCGVAGNQPCKTITHVSLMSCHRHRSPHTHTHTHTQTRRVICQIDTCFVDAQLIPFLRECPEHLGRAQQRFKLALAPTSVNALQLASRSARASRSVEPPSLSPPLLTVLDKGDS